MSMMVLICVLFSVVEQHAEFCGCVEGEGFIVLVGQKGDVVHDDDVSVLGLGSAAVMNCRPVTLLNHLRPSGMMYFLRKG